MPENHLPIRQIIPRNILSFGPESEGLDLRQLNVLIGPNGSGKSNLIDVLALMFSTQADFRRVLSRGGGVREWLYKGVEEPQASVEVLVGFIEGTGVLRHQIAFDEFPSGLVNFGPELIQHMAPSDAGNFLTLYERDSNRRTRVWDADDGAHKDVANGSEETGLTHFKGSISFPELHFLANLYKGARIYRDWTSGRSTLLRSPQPADLRPTPLEEDFSNLGLYLSKLCENPKAKRALIAGLKDLYEGITDFGTSVTSNTVHVFFTEGDFSIPATRLSDGTLRYLCLLAILLDPAPPPLICIEEPELGLHPDLLPKIADYLVAASERTQLIVTTHSEILVDALTEHPESVVICEKQDGQTRMKRLKTDDLKVWLQEYRLGHLWTSGQLGGTRW